MTLLSTLLPSQFEEVLFRVKVPVNLLPGHNSSQMMRAIEVIRYLGQLEQLEELAQIIEKARNPSVPSEPGAAIHTDDARYGMLPELNSTEPDFPRDSFMPATSELPAENEPPVTPQPSATPERQLPRRKALGRAGLLVGAIVVATLVCGVMIFGHREQTRDSSRQAVSDLPIAPDREAPPAAGQKPIEASSKSAIAADAPQPSTTGSSPCPADMIRVPAGTFPMGSPDNIGNKLEHPQHQVTLSAYCIDRTEVTVAAYARCAASGKCTPAVEPTSAAGESWCNGTRADRQDHPVNCVTWPQANSYCESLGRRLPSEAEWEYAARGNDGRPYPWGSDPPSARRLNGCGEECRVLIQQLHRGAAPLYANSDSWETTAPVTSFPDGDSPFGVRNMAGNVAEWTADRAGQYSAESSRDPHGSANGTYRITRGGSWEATAEARLRTTARGKVLPQDYAADLGFRCALSAP